MGEVVRRLAEAGVNITLPYSTFGGVRLVLGVDHIDRARAAAQQAMAGLEIATRPSSEATFEPGRAGANSGSVPIDAIWMTRLG
jgi:hypothetical protein